MSVRKDVDRAVLFVAAGLTLLFVLWGVLATDSLVRVSNAALAYVIEAFGWFFILSAAAIVVLAAALAVSRYGRVRLGEDTDRPEFRTVSWVAMMFSAGMGIGLMFFGAAEPLSHFEDPPLGQAAPESPQAAKLAIQYSYFHWAIHPWSMYAVVGLSIAYFTFRKGAPNLVSSTFRPLIGERVEGGSGKAIDILAIFATLFGSATSLGLGALQINGGLNALFGVPGSIPLAIGVIASLTVAFVISAVTGVHRGIQWLSNTNMVLAVLLLLFLFVVGPTVFILNTFTESIGAYLTRLVSMSFQTAAFGGAKWLSTWTLFYWAWWISWTPFVGAFIARISKGRTIRQFVVGVILVPSLVSFVWFAILGGTALHLQQSGRADLAAAAASGPEYVLFAMLRVFPLFGVTAVLVTLLVALFFVSGADAASVVLGTLSSRGTLRPATTVVIMWGVLTGAVAAVLLLAGGETALDALQTVLILAAAPFLLVVLGMCVSLVIELRREPRSASARPKEDR
ncbi:BCCT family transporter [Streptosporangium sp. KLBMP 9127]|nr:BCCT family transporter [Streptosporangium sp. KLBMP 9127]